MAAGPDGVFAAVGRTLYGAASDGSGVRDMGTVRGGAVAALSELGGTLYAASGDRIFTVPTDGGAAPTLYTRVPGDVHGLFAAEDGLYVAIGRTLWRIDPSRKRVRIGEAPSTILAVTGGNRNIYYAWRRGKNVEIGAPGSERVQTLAGLKRIDSLYLDADRNALFYSWTDGKGPHYHELPLSSP
jgi:hypothetical protein